MFLKISDLYLSSGIINDIFKTLLLIIGILKATLFIAGLFFTRKFKPAKNKHKYAICIAARNEEKVRFPIGGHKTLKKGLYLKEN